MRPLNKKLILGIFVLLLVGFSFVFRSNISRLLIIRKTEPPPVALPPLAKVGGPSFITGENKTEIPKSPVVSGALSPVSKYPPYKGRDPAEIRPVPEEIKLFNEAQLVKIYNSIKEDAGFIRSNFRFFDAWIHLGILKKTIGDFEGARDAWEYAGVIEPGNSISFANLGELYWRYLHDYPKSEANFKISIKNKPGDPLTYVSLTDLYHYSYKGKEDFAPKVLLDGLEANPGDLNLIKHLAYIYKLRGELSESLKWWEKAAEENYPYDQDVRDEIDRIKAKLGGS